MRMFENFKNWWNYAPVEDRIRRMIPLALQFSQEVGDDPRYFSRIPEGVIKQELIKESKIIRDSLRRCMILIVEKKYNT